MRIGISIFLLVSQLAMFSQTNPIVGKYYLKLESDDSHLFEYELNLNQDGTFFFHYYSKINRGVPPEVHKYGKGNWTEKNNVITFITKSSDLDEKHTLDFSKTKARFVTKSPRNKTDQIIKTKLIILNSEIFWMRGLDMFKI